MHVRPYMQNFPAPTTGTAPLHRGPGGPGLLHAGEPGRYWAVNALFSLRGQDHQQLELLLEQLQ